MIRRFERIDGAGIFDHYKWNTETPDFERINVIFGGNGSGKTSLASAFERARGSVSEQDKLSLYVEEAGSFRSTASSADPIFNRIYVFNEDYVSKSHRFSESEVSMDSILTVGERSVEADAELEQLRLTLPGLAAAEREANSSLATARASLQKCYEAVSKAVVADLASLGGKYQSRSNYSKAVVERKYAGSRSSWSSLIESALVDSKKLIVAPREKPITAGVYDVAARSGITAEVSKLLAATPTTIMLDTLQAHPEATRWVDEGRQLHAMLDQCLYCSQPLSGSRKANIDTHFSGAVAATEASLRAVRDEFKRLQKTIEDTSGRLPSRSDFYHDMRDRASQALERHRQNSALLAKWVADILDRIDSKLLNVLLPAADCVLDEPARVGGEDIEALVRDHNERVEKHDEVVQAAATCVEEHHLKDTEPRVDECTHAIENAQDALRLARGDLAAARDRVAALENVEGDSMPSVDVLNAEVARILGRHDLLFLEVNGRYSVTRNGLPATRLSEGERTAITLIHFMEMVARHDGIGGPIVIIDDPVSSLDGNVFMGISTYIWTECLSKTHVEQLFVLTHSFELFRQWDVQIEALHKNGQMKKLHPSRTYELSARHTRMSGVTSRKPAISEWPSSPGVRKKMRSSYHHAFLAAVEAKEKIEVDDTVENRLDAQLLFPNVIRRMLETFMGFKRPDQVGDFTGLMRSTTGMLRTAGYTGDPDALRQQLTRYAHTYSHSETPDTTSTISPDEIVAAIASVFTFMRAVDRDHFDGLCKILGKDPLGLAGTADTVSVPSDTVATPLAV